MGVQIFETIFVESVSMHKVNGGKLKLKKRLYRLFTGLLGILFVGILVMFIGYPLWPYFQELKMKILQLSPYNVSYVSTVQMMVAISPPADYVDTDTGVVTNDTDDDQAGLTIESVGPNAEIAHLEDQNARMEIPSASISGRIVDGLSQENMLRGFWHYPDSDSPGELGNTVIFGHRFQNIPPEKDTFYYLDRVKIGDKVNVYLDGERISYTVIDTEVIAKDDVSVFKQRGDYRLTLITCTPLWTAEKRLVVVALQDEVGGVL